MIVNYREKKNCTLSSTEVTKCAHNDRSNCKYLYFVSFENSCEIAIHNIKLDCNRSPALSGRRSGWLNFSQNDTIIDNIPKMSTIEVYTILDTTWQ